MPLADQRHLFMRVDELVVDGYLRRDISHPNVLVLTFKGLDVLLSFADRPISKGTLRKVTREAEQQELAKGSGK